MTVFLEGLDFILSGSQLVSSLLALSLVGFQVLLGALQLILHCCSFFLVLLIHFFFEGLSFVFQRLDIFFVFLIPCLRKFVGLLNKRFVVFELKLECLLISFLGGMLIRDLLDSGIGVLELSILVKAA